MTPYLLSHLLDLTAARQASHQAVSLEGQSLTYGDLASQSDRLARALQDAGVGREDRVGILMEKSLAYVVSIFGVLKAGAAYVPLDFGVPAPRLNYIVRNGNLKALVCNGKLRTLPAVVEGADELETLIYTTADPGLAAPSRQLSWETVMAGQSGPKPLASTEQDLAYVLYTSGSTGEPKGVRISHRNALAFVDWAADTFAMGAEDRVSNHAPFHFDLSILDLFATIKTGGTVCPVPADTAKFPVELGRFIENERITVWYSVPSALMLLLERGKLDSRDLSRLRTVLFAGEVFPVRQLRSLMETLPGPRYCNLYGPTETNVITWYEVAEPPQGTQPLPIGRPCANADTFILGEGGREVVEPGVVGELFARGPTVAMGYHGDSERTARSFVADPLRPGSPHRVYRTGDRVSLGDDGNYLFHGRADFQVKVNGYRVELGEIETALQSHALVSEAAVLTATDDQGSDYLRAFVVLTGEVSSDELKRHCAQVLPPYMVPREVLVLESLPRTSNGKIDRTRLDSQVSQSV